MTSLPTRLLLVWMFAAALPATAAQPSFDCTKAQGFVEHAICDSEQFAGFDRALAATYRALREQPEFKTAYADWLRQRNACSDNDCLRERYLDLFERVFSRHGGTVEPPLVPHPQCLRPLLPQMNGDQGFYAMRVVAPIRACDDLNFNLETSDPSAEYTSRFIERRGDVYFFQLEEHSKEYASTSAYRIGVRFSVARIDEGAGKPEGNLIISLVESATAE